VPGHDPLDALAEQFIRKRDAVRLVVVDGIASGMTDSPEERD
jgi:hypothetical protein